MKYVLAALCGILILFMGGCAILSVVAFPFPLIPGGIAALNVAILGALFGWKFQWKPAFYILGIADLLLALGAALIIAGMAGDVGLTSSDAQHFWLASALFALKGGLTLYYAFTLKPQAPL
jgi:hypothetical protein